MSKDRTDHLVEAISSLTEAVGSLQWLIAELIGAIEKEPRRDLMLPPKRKAYVSSELRASIKSNTSEVA